MQWFAVVWLFQKQMFAARRDCSVGQLRNFWAGSRGHRPRDFRLSANLGDIEFGQQIADELAWIQLARLGPAIQRVD